MMKILTAGLCVVLLATLMSSGALHAASSCESLASMTLPNTTITLARDVQAGAFVPPALAGATAPQAAGQAFRELPAFCRVAATLAPSKRGENR